ncbi:MAG: hypothetical protein QM626_03675 [Microbacterium sp.]|uniref:cupin domain-containing protein n=1 Tax=Microbacterium sp. TaxID=51671 RepID=UPI0039E642A6
MTEINELIQPVTERFFTFTPDLDEVVAEGQKAMPGWLPPRSGMRRFAAPADLTLRSGFTVFGDNIRGDTSYWTKEVWCVLEGRAVLEIEDLETGEKSEHRVAAGDGVYFPEAVRLTVVTGDERLVIFYCAVPASARDSHWIAALTQQDIDNARMRLAFEAGRA